MGESLGEAFGRFVQNPFGEGIAGCQSPSKVAGFVTRIGNDPPGQLRVWRVDGGLADNPV